MGRRSNQRLDENAIHLTLFAYSGMQIPTPVKISLAYISGKDQYASSGRIFAFYHHPSSSAGRLGSAFVPCHSPGLRRHSQSRRLTCSSLFLVLSFSSLWLSWSVWDYLQLRGAALHENAAAGSIHIVPPQLHKDWMVSNS